jgi:hypothetical protein
MTNQEDTNRDDRNVAGSAIKSKAPGMCLAGALIIFFAIMQLMFNDYAADAFSATSGKVVVIIWSICGLCLLLVGAWTSKEKREPWLSLADLMPHRVIGATIFFIAVLASLLLGI